MNKMLFGLLAFGLLAGASFAMPSDYNYYKKTGGCLRYVGPAMSYPYITYPLGHPDEYEEVSITQLNYGSPAGPSNCPRVNGVPIC